MIKSLYDRVNQDGLLVLPENKTRAPLEKKLFLAEPVHVDRIGYGYFIGEWATVVRLSYSPLIGYPYEHPFSRIDVFDQHYSIEFILSQIKNKQPKNVFLCGGEPLYKYEDEVKFLTSEIGYLDYNLIVETCGLYVPENINTFYKAFTYIRVQIDSTKVVQEKESGGYAQHIRNQINDWVVKNSHNIEFICHIDCKNYDTCKQEIVNHILFFEDIRPNGNELRICFVPKEWSKLHISHYRILEQVVSTFLLNFYRSKTKVVVQPNLNVIDEFF
jgi:organic radical activating enzyme